MIVRIRVDRGLVSPPSRDALRVLASLAIRAGRRLGFDTHALRRLGLRIVGDPAMIELHRAHLGTAVPTDVLSFPTEVDDDEDAPWTDDDDDAGPGDIAIDWDQVRRQAAVATPQGFVVEASQLVVHGLAHLAGHDHGRRCDARRMLRAERRAARSAGALRPTRPYGDGA